MKARALLVLCLVVACGGARPPPAAPVTLQPLAADARPPFVLEQRLRGRYGEREVDAHVVLQWHEGLLRLVGLAPFGARAFVVEQRGSEVRVENSLGRELPFDPRHVLVDIQRVLFAGFSSAQPDGEHELRQGGALIRERWQAGRALERRFVAPAGKGDVIVSFSGPAAPVIAPHVRLVNESLGYRLEIETLTQQWLE
jgi:Protein of unknown function (DUF3261)